MNSNKKIFRNTKLALCLAGCLITIPLLAGCQSTAPQSPAAPAQPADTAEAPAPAENTEQPAAPADQPDPVAADPAALPPLPAGAHYAAEVVSEEPVRIAFLGWANNPFHDQIREGVEAVIEYLKAYNCEVEYVPMGEDITMDYAVAALENAVVKQYDGIACIPGFDGTEIYIDKAVDAGIPVINCIAEGSKPSKRFAFYGQNGYEAGRLAGEIIEEYMGGSGKLGVITGVLGVTQHELRKNGAIEYLAENDPDVEVVGIYENNDKAETAYSLTRDMLTANPDLKCVYVTAGGPFGAAKAIQDLGLTGKVGVVGFDWLPDSLQYVESGEMVALISQDPFSQGFDTCVMLYNHITNGFVPESEIIDVEPLVVTPETLLEQVPDYGK